MSEQRSEFLGTAFRAAMLAGEIILQNLGKLKRGDVDRKQASDFVTRVDRESEAVILKTLREDYPDHHFFTEESLQEVDTGDYRWIIDPLDGTTNYIHGYPVFSVSIALQFGGEPLLGVVFDPLRKELYSAEKGKGAFMNGEKVTVSGISDLQEGLIATGFPFRKKDLIDPYLTLFKKLFNRVSDIRRAGSAALDLAHLACGRCDGFFELGLSPWDVAAGSILIQEAGGVVSDFGGGGAFLTTGNIVAACPALHDEILREVKSVFKGVIDT